MFKCQAYLMKDLILKKSVATDYPVISMMITYDSEKVIVVTKKSDEEVWVI